MYLFLKFYHLWTDFYEIFYICEHYEYTNFSCNMTSKVIEGPIRSLLCLKNPLYKFCSLIPLELFEG